MFLQMRAGVEHLRYGHETIVSRLCVQLQHCSHVEVCLLQPVSRSSLDKSSQGKDYFGVRNVAGVGFSPLLTAGAAEDTINFEGMPFVTHTIWQSYASLMWKRHPLCSMSSSLYAVITGYPRKFQWEVHVDAGSCWHQSVTITGGMGALGSLVGSWAAAQGASHVSLLARSRSNNVAGPALAAAPCSVCMILCDIALQENVHACLQSYCNSISPGPQHVLHASKAYICLTILHPCCYTTVS